MRSGQPLHRFTSHAGAHPTLSLQIKTEGLQHFNLWVPALLSAYLNLRAIRVQLWDKSVTSKKRKQAVSRFWSTLHPSVSSVSRRPFPILPFHNFSSHADKSIRRQVSDPCVCPDWVQARSPSRRGGSEAPAHLDASQLWKRLPWKVGVQEVSSSLTDTDQWSPTARRGLPYF